MLFTWLLSICTSTCTAEKTANNTRKTICMEKNKIRSLFLTLHKYQADERPQYQTLNGEHDREKLHVGEGFLKRFPKFNKPYPVLTNGAEWNQKPLHSKRTN